MASPRQLDDLTGEIDALVYSISHDLRAPLRHIHGFAQVLAEDAGPRLLDEERRCLDRILGAAKRMDAMIAALLELSSLGRRPLAKENVPLNEVVAEARADVAAQETGREVNWSIAPLPTAHADRSLLRLAFANLFSNALKYSRGRSPAHVEVGARAETGSSDETVVWVRDNGVGFGPSGASRLFGPFQRLHTQSQFEGLGVGLAAVRRILARHGGRTWAESTEGAGATFYLSLPAVP